MRFKMKRIMTNGVLAVAGMVLLLPAAGNASTIFNLSNNNGFGSPSSLATGTATVDFTTLTYGGTTDGGSSGANNFQFIYQWASGTNATTITLKALATIGAFTAGETLLTVKETQVSDLLPNNNASSVNLYAGATTLTFDSNFKSQLGLSTTTPPASVYTPSNFSVTGTSGTVTSASAMLVATPEPASLAMFGFALLAGIGFKFARKLNFKSSRS